MSEQGVETGRFGGWLTERFRDTPSLRGHVVYFDHGDKRRYSNVVAPKGFCGAEVSNANRLADMDVLIVGPSGHAELIIEIEERPCAPKKILGDVLALVLCNGIAVKGDGRQIYYDISRETSLIVAGIQPGRGSRLAKIETVIEPRLHELGAPPDAINPSRVRLVFSTSIGDVIERLKGIVAASYPIRADR